MSNILLINDMAGYGKVALSAMIPILSNMKHQIYNLPTALVSNTLDYGKFEILETTDYMKNSLNVWEQLGFKFDAVSTGFIVSAEQTKLVSEYCKSQKSKGTYIFVDPIMGDDGKLYNGVTGETVSYMRSMCGTAHVIMPNFTEAVFLADKYKNRESLNITEAEDLINILHSLGAESVVITSMNIDNQMCTMVLNGETDKISIINYDVIPVRFPGTGDIFSSVLIGNYLDNKNLESSVKSAMKVVERLIDLNKDNADKYKGIPIEQYSEVINSGTT